MILVGFSSLTGWYRLPSKTGVARANMSTMELTDREYEVVTNVYGEEMPRDLRQVETEQLVAMHERVSEAIQACYVEEPTDRDSLGIFLPLEGKIVQVLHERL